MSRLSTRPKPIKKSSPKRIVIKKQTNKHEQIEEKKVEKKTNKDSQKKWKQNTFGDELLSILYDQNRSNVILSPFSVLIALTICMNGSNNNTLQQMTNILHPKKKNKQLTFKQTTNITNQSVNIWKHFNKYDGSNNKPLIKIINKLFIQQKFKILPKYIKAVQKHNIESINFMNRKNAAKIINGWCQKNTAHKIKKIVTSKMLSNVQLIAVNAIYFNGLFVNKFGKNNTEKNVSFYYNNNKSFAICNVEMMHSIKSQYFKQKVNDIYDIVKLEYKNSDLSLILVIDNYSSNSNETLCFRGNYISSLNFQSKKKLNLFVPKFKYDFSVELNDELMKMGINETFERNADFSNMATDGFFIHLSCVVHKVSMNVTEEGNDVIKGNKSLSNVAMIRFDHPFTFYIYDDKKKIVLLSGVFMAKSV